MKVITARCDEQRLASHLCHDFHCLQRFYLFRRSRSSINTGPAPHRAPAQGRPRRPLGWSNLLHRRYHLIVAKIEFNEVELTYQSYQQYSTLKCIIENRRILKHNQTSIKLFRAHLRIIAWCDDSPLVIAYNIIITCKHPSCRLSHLTWQPCWFLVSRNRTSSHAAGRSSRSSPAVRD